MLVLPNHRIQKIKLYLTPNMNIFENEKLSSNELSFLALTLMLSIILLLKLLILPKKSLAPPPAPLKLPIIGHLHHLVGKLAHRSLGSLSNKYGGLMLLYFGNKPTLIVSSATAAEEILKTHDVAFVDRYNMRFNQRLCYNGSDIAFGMYGEKWRHMKSICVLQLLSNKRVLSFRPIREDEVGQLVEEIRTYKGSVINLSETIVMRLKGLISRTALGNKYNDHNRTSSDFYNLFKELMAVMGEVSLGDYIPFLAWVDSVTGLEARVDNVWKQFDVFIEKVIQEHEVRSNENQQMDEQNFQRNQDFVDVLLDVQRNNPEKHSRNNIKALILDMFVGATETSATTLEWAMAELLRNPTIMKNVQDEVRSVIKNSTKVTEDDLEYMKYLKAVVKETLRLHPPVPLFGFRVCSQKVQIEGYEINPNIRLIINAWAIQRDPKLWQEPEEFRPERFLDNSVSFNYGGQHSQFIPFGAGRRGCPGAPYGIAIVELVLANLLSGFNWTLPNIKGGETLDVDERVGIAVGRRNPLLVTATANFDVL